MMDKIIIAGPCVIESYDAIDKIAARLSAIEQKSGTSIIFKASFDKANRTSIHSFRGIGMEEGLHALYRIKQKYGFSLLTDIHESWQAAPVAEVVDILQIPAFLCRQTDLVVNAAKTGKIVNIKKGQFLSGIDMQYPIEKARISGAKEVWATERGNMFGYNNLIVDFRNIPAMRKFADRVIMDCTHVLQTPGGEGAYSGGDNTLAKEMANAAKVFGADGFFFETHTDPQNSKSDKGCIISTDYFEQIVTNL